MHDRTGILSSVISFLFVTSLLVFMGAGCGGGDDGKDGANALVDISEVAAGTECPDGGFRITIGLDANGDGELQDEEMTSENVICNGTTGAEGTRGAQGTTGETGEIGQTGEIGETGETGETGDTGNPGEPAFDLLTVTTDLPEGDANCPFGGVRVDVGLDNGDGGGTANDGTLQDGEIDDVAFICNGEPVYKPEPVDPPGGDEGTATIKLNGGQGSTGNGGYGGYLGAQIYGVSDGHILLFKTGQADASFTCADAQPYLGDNPVVAVSSGTIPSLPWGDHSGLADGQPHLHDGYTNLYIYDDATTDHTVATGLHVPAGVTVTLQKTSTNNGGETGLYLQNDVHIEGTLVTEKKTDGSSGGDLWIQCANYFGGPDSSIDLAGDAETDQNGGSGGYFGLYATNTAVKGSSNSLGMIVNEGAVNTSGGSGLSGGSAGYIYFQGNLGVCNTGALTAVGGDGEDAGTDSGNGGSGGYIQFYTNRGLLGNAGDLNTMGGDAMHYAGSGGYVRFDLNNSGSMRNSGNIRMDGGEVDSGCTVNCYGGNAGYFESYVYGGDTISSGDISAVGGSGAGGPGGYPGYIRWYSYQGSGWYTGDMPAGDITISGNLDASGGSGTSGREGCWVEAYIDASPTPQNQQIRFLGYSLVQANGGSGISGARGGSIDLQYYNDNNEVYAPNGGIYSHVDLEANGGDGISDSGGEGGYFGAYVEPDVESNPEDTLIAHNYGQLDLSGGDGLSGGGDGGYISIVAPNGAENHGDVIAVGGTGTGAGAWGGGHRNYPTLLMSADVGPAVNTGDVDMSGGDSTGSSGTGGPGGIVDISGTTIDASGGMNCSGGDASGATSTGGGGGSILLFSSPGSTSYSGTFDIGGGTGTSDDGNHGMVVVDGVNVTDDYLP